MIKRLISQEKIEELEKQKEKKNLLIIKLKIAGCSEAEIKELTK
jgi:hypothetical protein